MTIPATNEAIADKLREMADVIEQQQAESFRVNAYRRAAQSLIALGCPVDEVWHNEGLA